MLGMQAVKKVVAYLHAALMIIVASLGKPNFAPRGTLRSATLKYSSDSETWEKDVIEN